MSQLNKQFESVYGKAFEELNACLGKKTQDAADEKCRRTKVKIISTNSFQVTEAGINDFIYKKQEGRDKAFLLIDIKYTAGIGYSEALIIYSEICKPEENL